MRRSLVILIGLLAGQVALAVDRQFPPIQQGERILVVAPHPDDEVLGAAGVMQQAVAVGAEVHVVYLTNGDHNQIAFKLYNHQLFLRPRQYLAFGEQRRREAIAATSLLGLTTNQLTFLGYPDFGTLRMWRDYWKAGEPFRSDATQSNAVPYREAWSFGKAYRPENIVADFFDVFRAYRPTRIFVTHPCDTNPDHRAAANFVRLAVLALEETGQHPLLQYYVIHYGEWPRPYHFHPELTLEPPPMLLDNGDWTTLPLTPDQTERKYDAILRNRTQTTTRQYFLVAFARANELFATIAPDLVPRLPAGERLDWRKAVRNKTIPGAYYDVQPPKLSSPNFPAGEAPGIALEHTEFLRQGDDLIAQIELKNRLGKRTGVHLFIFGYQRGQPFEALPKMHIIIGPLGAVTVSLNGQRIRPNEITVTSVANRFFIRIPMQLLGGAHLDYIFTATRAHLREISPDDTAWQLFALEPQLREDTHD
jgi:LmbE family N-acetylglucosaminyl deacetylase